MGDQIKNKLAKGMLKHDAIQAQMGNSKLFTCGRDLICYDSKQVYCNSVSVLQECVCVDVAWARVQALVCVTGVCKTPSGAFMCASLVYSQNDAPHLDRSSLVNV